MLVYLHNKIRLVDIKEILFIERTSKMLCHSTLTLSSCLILELINLRDQTHPSLRTAFFELLTRGLD